MARLGGSPKSGVEQDARREPWPPRRSSSLPPPISLPQRPAPRQTGLVPPMQPSSSGSAAVGRRPGPARTSRCRGCRAGHRARGGGCCRRPLRSPGARARRCRRRAGDRARSGVAPPRRGGGRAAPAVRGGIGACDPGPGRARTARCRSRRGSPAPGRGRCRRARRGRRSR